jgi:Sensors of blue-light using FAD
VTQLIRCIYASLAAPSFKEDELPLLLERARHANAGQSLTGMLLYIEGSFFQVLEGEAEAVDAVYTRIIRDPRHTRVTLIIREPIAQRDFSEWTMGFSVVDRLDAGELIGENDFFTKASCIDDLDAGRAKKLLAAFRNGRWRLERTGVQPVVGPIT